MHPVKNNLIKLKLTITKLPETHANLYKIHFSFLPQVLHDVELPLNPPTHIQHTHTDK